MVSTGQEMVKGKISSKIGNNKARKFNMIMWETNYSVVIN